LIRNATSQVKSSRTEDQAGQRQVLIKLKSNKNLQQARENKPSAKLKAKNWKGKRRSISAVLLLQNGLPAGLARSFKDQAGNIEGNRKRIADGHRLGGIGQTEGAGTFEQPARLNGIAAL
jgi:hypothetical protein